MDDGFTGEAAEHVEIVEIIPRLSGLHGDAAERARANGRTTMRCHEKYIEGNNGPAFDPDQCGCQPRCGGLPRSQAITTNDLDQGAIGNAPHTLKMWQAASNAPLDCDLELAVIDKDGQHTLVFPCRRVSSGWINAATKERLDVRPTHWRPWAEKH